jgi:hypothetical protein
MGLITQRRGKEWPRVSTIPRNEDALQGKNTTLEWLSVPPRKRTPKKYTTLDAAASVSVPVGSHAYWIRVQQFQPELCRMACRKDALIMYEVLLHDSLGITDDDLDDAVLKTEGDFRVNGEYRISDHIKTKLQILHEP